VGSYRLLIKASAARELEAVDPKRDRQRIVRSIRELGDDPRPPNCEKLSGHDGKYRIRVGSYRIVYTVDDGARTVTIVKVGHRKDVHRELRG